MDDYYKNIQTKAIPKEVTSEINCSCIATYKVNSAIQALENNKAVPD